MKIQTTIILGIILSLVLVSAETIYSGESYSFISEQFDYYEVIGNSSSIEGMNISWENGNTTISFHPAFKEDNFTLVFWKDKAPIVEHHYSGGGGCGLDGPEKISPATGTPCHGTTGAWGKPGGA